MVTRTPSTPVRLCRQNYFGDATCALQETGVLLTLLSNQRLISSSFRRNQIVINQVICETCRLISQKCISNRKKLLTVRYPYSPRNLRFYLRFSVTSVWFPVHFEEIKWSPINFLWGVSFGFPEVHLEQKEIAVITLLLNTKKLEHGTWHMTHDTSST